jgi:hypothetical protein
VNAVPSPVDPPPPPQEPPGEPSISAAADRARAQLHEEIERVRRGVEEMLADQRTPFDADLRRELDTMNEDLRRYVKQRVRKSERRSERSVGRLEERTEALERRLDGLDAERRLAEYRIHTDTERMLDGLLQEVRAIADRLEGKPQQM